ncbi:MAG: HPF/RaiA family ribosome-associated protein [Gammaproteobacteria bacterium]|nr:HPF/RaiA family ribosome-associated protein [Gammaproteobacteria bacterium]
MQLPLQINFHNIPPSEALEARIREKVQKLTRITDSITGCRVTIDTPHKHHHKGATYQVTIDLTLPGNELVVSRDPGLNHAHENAYVAVRDAFNALSRQLANYVRQRQGKSRQHQQRDLDVLAM